MTAVALTKFGGMIPRTQAQLLPDIAAGFASNCDFATEVVKPLKGGLQQLRFQDQGSATGKGIYTLDGIYWYTWNTEVDAYKSPVIDETFHRIYYIETYSGVKRLKVAISPESTAQPADYLTGGSPAQSWLAGVPNPTEAPTLTLVNRTTLADYPTASITFKTYWVDKGVRYGETTLTNVTTVTPFVLYSVPGLGSIPAGAPATATLVVQATLADGDKTIFTLNTDTNTTAPATSSALPGGVEMTLTTSSGTYFVHFNWGVVETRAYIYTEVNTWLEESGPSPAALISPTYMQDVLVEVTDPDFTGYRPRGNVNIYRTYGTASYLKIPLVVSPPGYMDFTRTLDSVSVALRSLEWVPPVPALAGLVQLPNGWFAAYKDNVLYMSEPYHPHAWPYSISFPKSIKGICAGAQSLVVTTAETCYVVLGPHPAAVNQVETQIPVGGISQRSMVKFEQGVAYLSNDGIVVVQGSSASLELSQMFFTRENWRDAFGDYLSSLVLAYHDGFLVCVSTTDTVGFLVRLDEATGAFCRFDYQFNSLMRLPVQDTLYYVSNRYLYRFRASSPLSAVWLSKTFIYPTYTKFGIGFARMTGSPGSLITVELFCDEAPVYSKTLDPSVAGGTTYFRLPAHRGGLKWQFRVTTSGDCELQVLSFAHSPDELKHV